MTKFLLSTIPWHTLFQISEVKRLKISSMGERLCLSRTSVYLFTLHDFFVLSGALKRLFIVYKRIRYLKLGKREYFVKRWEKMRGIFKPSRTDVKDKKHMALGLYQEDSLLPVSLPLIDCKIPC